MDAKTLAKIKRLIAECRAKPFNTRPRDVIRIAKALGRKEVNRGKEPTYESTELDTNVVTIPKHGAATLAPGTARRILDQLEYDVFLFEEQIKKSKQTGVTDENEYIH